MRLLVTLSAISVALASVSLLAGCNRSGGEAGPGGGTQTTVTGDAPAGSPATGGGDDEKPPTSDSGTGGPRPQPES